MTEPHPPASSSPGPQASPATPPADPTSLATLEDVLAAAWRDFWGSAVPDGWATHAATALDAHLTQHPAPATACEHRDAGRTRAALERLRRLIREQLADAVAADDLDIDLANGMLTACDLPALRRRWRVCLTVPVTVEVTAEDDEDAYVAATDAVETALSHDEGFRLHHDHIERDSAEPGPLDTSQLL